MNIDQLKTLFKKYHLSPNFTYGQNFLVDDSVLDEIIAAADLTKDDAVLEIGAGIGNLTERLLQAAGFVLSLEKDPKFLSILKSLKSKHKNFHYEIVDALEFNFQEVLTRLSTPGPSPYKVVANIPYYITGKILQTLLTAKIKPLSITILTQKEVAQSIIAKAGNLSVLAISVQIFGEPKIVKIVKPESFYPAPKVESAILHISLYQRPKYRITDEKRIFRILKSCFAGKRKQIHNTLANNLRLEKGQVEKILTELKINPAARPQELSIEQWIALSKLITDNS